MRNTAQWVWQPGRMDHYISLSRTRERSGVLCTKAIKKHSARNSWLPWKNERTAAPTLKLRIQNLTTCRQEMSWKVAFFTKPIVLAVMPGMGWAITVVFHLSENHSM